MFKKLSIFVVITLCVSLGNFVFAIELDGGGGPRPVIAPNSSTYTVNK